MDFSINNYNKSNLSFSAKFDRISKKAIMNGIYSEVRKEKNVNVAMKKFDALTDKFENIKKVLAEKFDKGKFSFYNELGLNSKVDKIAFTDGNSFKSFILPDDISHSIKVADKSNIFVSKYAVNEFPANKLDWLLEFFKNLKV